MEPFVRQKCLQQLKIGRTFATHLGYKCIHRVLTNKNTRDYAERTEHRDPAESD